MIFLLALRPTIRHFQRRGGCCGGGGEERKPQRKKLDGPKVAEKRISIQGMHCEACQNRVERQLNSIDGVAANVSWRRNQAVVSLSRPVSDEELTAAVTGAGYQVTGIQTREVSQLEQYTVTSMSCAACSARVEKAVSRVPGASPAR